MGSSRTPSLARMLALNLPQGNSLMRREKKKKKKKKIAVLNSEYLFTFGPIAMVSMILSSVSDTAPRNNHRERETMEKTKATKTKYSVTRSMRPMMRFE